MAIRFLKKIKLFDLFLIFIFIASVVSLYFLLFRTKKELTIVVKAFEDSVSWPDQRSSVWFNKLFYPRMKEKDTFGNTVAEIIKVRKYDNRPDQDTVYLTLKIKTVYSPGSRTNTYKGKNVLIGSTLQLFLDNVFVEAMIVSIGNSKDRYPLKKLLVQSQLKNETPVYLETSGVNSYIADNINEGSIIKDTQGRTILKILRVDVEDAKKIVTTANGEVLLRRDPLKKDVYLTLEVSAFKVDNRYFFFDDIAVLIDKPIPIHLDFLSIFPVVTSVKEVK